MPPMERKSAISYILAAKKPASSGTESRKNVRAIGFIVRSNKVLITERRDVPVVHAVKKKY